MSPRSIRFFLNLVVLSLAAVWPWLAISQNLEATAESGRYALRGPRPIEEPVIVVAVDDATLDAWSHLPMVAWSGPLAQITDRILQDGAKSVGLDFIFMFDIDTYLGDRGVMDDPLGRLGVAIYQRPEAVVLATATGDDVVDALLQGSPPVALASAIPMYDPAGRVVAVPRLDLEFEPPILSFAARVARASPGARPVEIDFSAAPIPTLSAENVRKGSFPKGTFRGRYVIVGETHRYSSDIHPTPTSAQARGAHINAEAVATLLGKREVARLSLAGSSIAMSLGVLPFLALAWTVGPLRYAFVAIATLSLYGLGSQWAFAEERWILPMIGPGMVIGLLVPLAVYTQRAAEEARERAWARERWGQMVSVPFRERIEADRRSGRGDWGALEAAFLFMDIEGFSKATLAETNQAVIIGRLNELFSVVVHEIERRGGAVLQFTGDGLSALFESGSPEGLEVARTAALEAALAVLDGTGGGSGHWPVRIGLAAGTVNLALVGSENRRQMTTYGEAINMASRMEQAGKKLTPRRRLVLPGDFEAAVRSTGRAFESVALDVDGWPEPIQAFALAEGDDSHISRFAKS